MKCHEFNRLKDQIHFYDGINGKEEYFQAVVLMLLIAVEDEYHVLFQKRCKHIRQGGEICFPGGKVDEYDVSLEATALRETYEELGIESEKIKLISRLNTVIAPMGAIVNAFIGVVHISVDEIKINPDEVDQFFLIPLSWFLNHQPEIYLTEIKAHASRIDPKTGQEQVLFPAEELGLPEIYHKPWGNFKHTVYVYHTEYGVIWGLTARLVYDCVKQIKGL